MDPILLARIQFAFTIGFHFIFPPLTIGMAWVISFILLRHLQTGDHLYLRMARFWIKVFTLSFAVGVATGITMEFQFGTNWATYSRFVGDIFGAPLAAEGVFAFFLESSFLGILIWGEKRVSRRLYTFAAFMVALGSTISGLWILIANSWQQTPAGYTITDGRAELTDFYTAMVNHSTLPRFLHTTNAAILTGSFFMMGISAWFLLKRRHLDFAEKSLKISLAFGLVTAILVLPFGHNQAVQVASTQPAKLAAFEGLWETRSNAPLLLFGIPDVERERTRHAIELPGFLSIGVGGKSSTVVRGLKDFPLDPGPPAGGPIAALAGGVRPAVRPPILLPFIGFHGMVYLWGLFMAVTAGAAFLLWRRKLFENRLMLGAILLVAPLPILANELGWMAAEVGRQPWIVYQLLRTDEAVSITVPAGQILASLIMFGILYALLLGFWLFLLGRKLARGPEAAGTSEVNP